MKQIQQGLIFIMILFPLCIFAQENHHTKKNEKLEDPGFEAVLSGLFMYTPENGNVNPASELHLTYWTTHKWAFGIGYTMIFEEEHRIGHEIAALVSHKPWSFLTVNSGPSFSLPNSHKDIEVSAYLEGEFAFKIGEFHLGPTTGILVGKEFKLFGGWHFSYEF